MKFKKRYTLIGSSHTAHELEADLPQSTENTHIVNNGIDIIIVENKEHHLEYCYYTQTQTLIEAFTVKKHFIVQVVIIQEPPVKKSNDIRYTVSLEKIDGGEICIQYLEHNDAIKVYDFLKKHTIMKSDEQPVLPKKLGLAMPSPPQKVEKAKKARKKKSVETLYPSLHALNNGTRIPHPPHSQHEPPKYNQQAHQQAHQQPHQQSHQQPHQQAHQQSHQQSHQQAHQQSHQQAHQQSHQQSHQQAHQQPSSIQHSLEQVRYYQQPQQEYYPDLHQLLPNIPEDQPVYFPPIPKNVLNVHKQESLLSL